MSVKAQYIGKKDEQGNPLAYINGIPAADLSDEEYDALSADQKRHVRNSGLYRVESAEKKADKPEKSAGGKAEG